MPFCQHERPSTIPITRDLVDALAARAGELRDESARLADRRADILIELRQLASEIRRASRRLH